MKSWISQTLSAALSEAPKRQSDTENLSSASLAHGNRDYVALSAIENKDEGDDDERERLQRAEKRAYVQRELADVLKRARWLEEAER